SNALADAHGLLTGLNWESAALDELVRAALRPVCGAAEARVAISGPLVRLRPKQAVSVAIALHEPATNALMHGALSAGDGRISAGRVMAMAGGPSRGACASTGSRPAGRRSRRPGAGDSGRG